MQAELRQPVTADRLTGKALPQGTVMDVQDGGCDSSR